jgi:hypothetical protein
MVDDLKAIPEHYKGQNIDLMLIHLGGTTIPSPSLPMLVVTMDAKQGIELVKLICPDLTIPILYEYVTSHFRLIYTRETAWWANTNATSVIMMSFFRHYPISRQR